MNQTQNSASRFARRVFLLAAALGCFQAAGGCGKVADEDTGSETHWLVRCDADAECGAARSCECGVCTRSCQQIADCSALGVAGVSCITPPVACGLDYTDNEPDPDGLCLLPCVRDTDCTALGADAACRGGRCELPQRGGASAGANGGAAGVENGGGGASVAGGSGNSAGSAGNGGSASGGEIQTLCDGSDEVRLLSRAAGGFVDSYYSFFRGYGNAFYAIDGRCRYWQGASDGFVYSGTLPTEVAQRFAEDLGFGQLSSNGYAEDDLCFDGGVHLIWTAEGSVECRCTCNNPDAPPGWNAAFRADSDARAMLLAGGEPLTGAAQLLLVESADPRSYSDVEFVQWPLARAPRAAEIWPFSAFGTLMESSGVRIEDAAELSLLRGARSAFRARGQGQPYTFVEWADAAADASAVRTFVMLLRDEVPAALRLTLDRRLSTL